jgi:hypothetical protein
LQDESAFLLEAGEAHDAVRTVCKQFIAVSTDQVPSEFHSITQLEESTLRFVRVEVSSE